MSEQLIVAAGNGVLVVEPNGSGAASHTKFDLEGAECVALAADATVFAGSHGDGVHRSSDGGRTFEKLDFPQPIVLSIAVSPADGAIYAGCEPSMLFRSRDGGETWTELAALKELPSAPTWSFPPRPWTHHVRQIAPSPLDPTLILVGIELGGIMRSEDDGVTWQDHRPGAVRDCHGLAWHPSAPGRAYEAGGGGSAWSHDGGQTWERIDDGRDKHFRHYLTGIAVDPTDADTWYVSAAPTPWQTQPPKDANAAIYRWRAGGPWEKLEGGLPDSLERYPFSLRCSPENVYAGFKDGQLWIGRDRGEQWSRLELPAGALDTVRDLAVVSG